MSRQSQENGTVTFETFNKKFQVFESLVQFFCCFNPGWLHKTFDDVKSMRQGIDNGGEICLLTSILLSSESLLPLYIRSGER